MPRIRTLKPEHRQHRKIGPLDHITYRLWVGMILEADDEGRLVCDTEQLRVTIFGYHVKVSRAVVEASLSRLDQSGLLKLYTAEHQRYAWFPSWGDHQKIDHPTQSKLPPYQESEAVREDSPNAREDSRLSARAGADRIGSDLTGSEGIGGEALTAPPREPSVIQFQIPDSIQQALNRSPILGAIPRLQQPAWWQAQVRANRGVDFAQAVLGAEAWLATNNTHRPKKDLARFLHNWLAEEHRRLHA